MPNSNRHNLHKNALWCILPLDICAHNCEANKAMTLLKLQRPPLQSYLMSKTSYCQSQAPQIGHTNKIPEASTSALHFVHLMVKNSLMKSIQSSLPETRNCQDSGIPKRNLTSFAVFGSDKSHFPNM